MEIRDLETGFCKTLEDHIAKTYDTNHISYSPDGSHIACCSEQSVWIIDLETGHSQMLESHANILGNLGSISYSPDGKYLACCSFKGDLLLWDIEQEICEKYGDLFYVDIIDITYSPNGKYLACGLGDINSDGVLIWDLVTGCKYYKLKSYHKNVYTVSISPNGRYLACGSEDGTVRILDLDTGSNRKCKVHAKKVDKGFFTRFYYNHAAEQKNHAKKVNKVLYNPNGTQLAFASDDSIVRIWNIESDSYFVLKGHTDKVTSVSFSPDGRYLASTSDDDTIRIWNAKSGEFIKRYQILDRLNLDGANFEKALLSEKDRDFLRETGARA